MTFRIAFHGPGDCVPKARPKVAGGHGYYPERPRGSKRLSYLDYRELVQVQCLAVLRSEHPSLLPVGPSFAALTWGLSVQVRCGAGDLGNIIGSIEDALQGILWANDRQVTHYGNCNLERVQPKA